MCKFSLKGRTALVTGGARGCGLAFARGLAEAGADIAIFDVIPASPALAQISLDYSVRAEYYEVDVTSLSSLEAGFAKFKVAFDEKLDIVVACAGVNKNVEFLETTESDVARLFDVNCKGLYFTAQLAAKQMIQNGTKHGSIILIASMASSIAIRSQRSSAYCATKGAVNAMVPPMAAELAGYGIRVNSVSPGYVRTEMTAPFPHLLKSWRDEVMLGRVAEPDDIKGACIFLASDASMYCTGSDIVVDGGVIRW
ncbi:hypothetical protein N0V93_004582 [Gnomoniopsis smithogilvyi]|uniref:Uncharacterized protein n=1 Tax=Gnomoniopsis smithogilvyi TaxID=1191159 RepID=A0A9W8YT48_9PEZI|nr:hypothetical protein N0V93_004582 [Gnomoniopsis smithogilvyi]